jgi:hypothetical protein
MPGGADRGEGSTLVVASIVPQTLTVAAFVAVAWLTWTARHRPLLATFLSLLLLADIAFVTWFLIEAYPCTPQRCDTDQAAVIIVFMVAFDLLLAMLFGLAAIGTRLYRARTR